MPASLGQQDAALGGGDEEAVATLGERRGAAGDEAVGLGRGALTEETELIAPEPVALAPPSGEGLKP